MAIINEEIGQNVTLRKVTQNVDGMGHWESDSTSDQTIAVSLQPITQKDRDLWDTGNVITGDMKMYAKGVYTCDEVEYQVEVNDIIIDWNTVQWRVITIVGKYSWGETEVFRKCLLRRIIS